MLNHDEPDDVGIEKISGWRWILTMAAFAVFCMGCGIAAGYVLTMIFNLIAGAAA